MSQLLLTIITFQCNFSCYHMSKIIYILYDYYNIVYKEIDIVLDTIMRCIMTISDYVMHCMEVIL